MSSRTAQLPDIETIRVPSVNAARRDENDELFSRRVAIQVELAGLEGASTSGGTRVRARRLKRELDDVTRDLVERNQGLVHSYVKRFTANASPADAQEFQQAGNLGLMHAIATYEVGKGTFAQWAYKRIQCEVLKSVRSTDHKTISAGDFERRPAILRAAKQLAERSEDSLPTYQEIAAEAAATVEQVRRVLEAPTIHSLHAPIGRDEDSTSLGDTIPDTDADVDREVLSKIDIEALERYGLAALDARELFVIARRFGLDTEPPQHLSAIGEVLGLSREAVRQIEAKALGKMAHPMILRRLVRHGREDERPEHRR